MYQVYLSLGTNLGNRKRNIREVIEKIGEQIGVVERQSALYETKPWGYSSPNDYINACVLVNTILAPRHDGSAPGAGGYAAHRARNGAHYEVGGWRIPGPHHRH